MSLALGLAASADSLANFWRYSNPDMTLRLRPDDAVSLTLKEDRLRAYEDPRVADALVMAAIARTALGSDPLNPVALRQLAVAESMARRQAASDRLIELAHRVSRREIGTTWLLINRSLDRGDAAGVVRSFDEALSTSADAAKLLFPALADGLFDEELRNALLPYIRSTRPWIGNFLRYAAASPEIVSDAAILIIAAGGLPDTSRFVGIDALVLKGLSSRRDYHLAARYLRQAIKLPEVFATDITVNPASLDSRAGPFGWRFRNGAEGGALAVDANMIVIRAEADRRMLVADRLLMLAPGRYALNVFGEASDEHIAAEVALYCTGSAARDLIIGTVTIAPTSTPTVLPFTVPAECLAQRLELIVSGVIAGEEELILSQWRLVRN